MSGNMIVKNASQVVTCSGSKAKQGVEMRELHVIDDGAVVIEDGIITAVGKTADILSDSVAEPRYEVVDAKGKTVLPGFVDSHSHFVFHGYRAEEYSWRLKGVSYMDIMKRGGGILSTVKATREASKEELIASGLDRLNAMLAFGVTTVEGKSGYGLDRDTELKQLEVMAHLNEKHSMDIANTFLGAHAIPPEYEGKGDAFIDFLIHDVLPEVAGRKLAEFCDVFCEQNVFSVDQSRRLLSKAKELGLKLKLHADEMVRIGGAELAAELGAVSADHLLQASDRGIGDLAENRVMATLLPGTAFSLKAPYARARYMIDQGCAVALATDYNPGSCFTESIPLIIALATLYMALSTEEVITALTLNGAAALDRADTIGSIDKGKKGDLIILEYPSYHFLPYHIGVSSVEKTIKKGTVVFDKKKISVQSPRHGDTKKGYED